MDKKSDMPVQDEGNNQLMNEAPPVQNEGNPLSDAESGAGSGGSNDGFGQETEKKDGDGEKEETGAGAGDGEAEETGEDPKVLTATYPILYLSRQYKPGEELPANNPDMVSAWIDAGTAAWMCAGKESPRAKPRTAEPGLPGLAAQAGSQDGGSLAGKVPVTKARKR